MSLDRLAEMADRVAEYAIPTVAALTEPQSSTTAIQELQAKVDQLTLTVAALKKHAGGTRRSSQSSRSHWRNPFSLERDRSHQVRVPSGITERTDSEP
ncbi:hypothetical protein HPB47_003138 [Ixodes persulcatus]|uniref:Uncharacterized protein n=1 Tax=Ixodes persulcatus TaxID=34615 RepID=A0AC60PJC7_IXOPE|nr:hypothetical protein HPB47_003138 [Ixodes persulcatus]